MQTYIKDFLKSRGYDEGDFIVCEICNSQAVEIHHINSSFRGKRTHKKDWSDLISVCRECQERIHDKNTQEVRDHLLNIARNAIA